MNSEAYYTGIVADSPLKVKLTGSWETVIGEQDTFVHILEYEHYGGYDKAYEAIQSTDVRVYYVITDSPHFTHKPSN